MGARCFDSDVVVIGGGPGGCATAITCASLGLSVSLLERYSSSVVRPGETLHPGVEPVLAQLGVADRLTSVVGSRHEGIRIRWGESTRIEPYGHDDSGPWRGYQVWRPDFDALLLNRAREVGVQVFQECAAIDVQQTDGVISGVQTTLGAMTASIVVDASGRSHWLGTKLGIERHAHSPSLVARYGYAEGSLPALDESPLLVGDASGWQWSAMIRPGLYQWAHVAFDGQRYPASWCPEEFRSLIPMGEPHGTDVTWRLSQRTAGPGWFMVGDAAAVLDPTSGKGILKALLSGITTGKLIAAVMSGSAPSAEVASLYERWLSEWFHSDAQQLSQFYLSLGLSEFRVCTRSETPPRNARERGSASFPIS